MVRQKASCSRLLFCTAVYGGRNPAAPGILQTLDTCVTPGFLPSALRAALRAFKIAPGDFVAGMTE